MITRGTKVPFLMSSWNPPSLTAQQTGGLTWTNLRISTVFSLPLCILSLPSVGPSGKSDLSHPGDIFQFFRGVRSFYSYAKLQSKVTPYRFVALFVFSHLTFLAPRQSTVFISSGWNERQCVCICICVYVCVCAYTWMCAWVYYICMCMYVYICHIYTYMSND